MKKTQETLRIKDSIKEAILYIAFELSHRKWKLVMEFFAWRDFKNGKQIGTLSGLTPTPYDRGASQREQDISKAGNERVEMAWVWLRFQPQSRHDLHNRGTCKIMKICVCIKQLRISQVSPFFG
jgi:transposase